MDRAPVILAADQHFLSRRRQTRKDRRLTSCFVVTACSGPARSRPDERGYALGAAPASGTQHGTRWPDGALPAGPERDGRA